MMMLLLFPAFAGPHADHLATFGQGTPLPPRPPQSAPPPGDVPRPDVTVYGYHAYWSGSPLDVDLDRLTHIAIFNVGLSSDGSLSSTDRWTDWAAELVPLAHARGVKVHLCVTSFDDTTTNAVLSSSTRRAAAASALASLVNDYGADGVNVDIEGMDAAQKENLIAFVQALKAVVPEVILATPAVDWSGAYDYDVLARESDGLFIMGYDYHWSGGDPGPVGPLYGGGAWSAYSQDWSVTDYRDSGTPDDKIILGLPLYGREWPTASSAVPGTATGSGSSVLMYAAVEEAETSSPLFDATPRSSDLRTSSRQLWYDDLDNVRERIAWAVDEGLQGVGFWALGYESDPPAFWSMVTDETAFDDGDDTGGGGGGGEGGGEPPVAYAGLPIVAYPGDTVILDGSPSYDPEGADLSFRWTQVQGTTVAISLAQTANPQITLDTAGVYAFELLVSDGVLFSEPDVVDVVVVDPDAGGKLDLGCATARAVPGRRLGLLGAALLALGLCRRRRLDGGVRG